MVDDTLYKRKYYRHGAVMLGFAHGEKEKPENLPLLMATEQQEAWAATRYHEWHLGHLHKSATKIKTVADEFNGVRVRTLPSLCGTDLWHFDMGYVQNIRSAEVYLFDPDRGLAGTQVFNLLDSDIYQGLPAAPVRPTNLIRGS